jgi:hypothetical protein
MDKSFKKRVSLATLVVFAASLILPVFTPSRVIAESYSGFQVPVGATSSIVRNISITPETEAVFGSVVSEDSGYEVNSTLAWFTHSASQTVEDGNSVACLSENGTNASNSYMRMFALGDFGISEDFEVQYFEIGVESSQAGNTGYDGYQEALISIGTYDDRSGFTWIAIIPALVPDVASNSNAQVLFEIPESVRPTISAGDTLVMDFFTPDGADQGNSFFFGSNDDGQSDYSYLWAPDCTGDDGFYTTDEVGAPFMHMVMNVYGEYNYAPVANNDVYSIAMNETLDVSAPGILSNDTDGDSDRITVDSSTDVSNGTLSVNPNGSFMYTPDNDFYGQDSFTYTIVDQSEEVSDEATVTINVEEPFAPVAMDDAYSVYYNDILDVSAPGVLANDSDENGDSIIVDISSVSPVSNGELTIYVDGSFVYVPDADFSGEDTFTYEATDGVLNSEMATVTITVREPIAPVANNDSYEVDQDDVLEVNAPGILRNDTDEDSNAIMAELLEGTSSGQLVFSSDGSFTYIPEEGFYGTDSFRYTAFDGELSSEEATVTITVNQLEEDDGDVLGTDDSLANTGLNLINILLPIGIVVIGISSVEIVNRRKENKA